MLENYFKLRKRTFLDYKRVSINKNKQYYIKKKKRRFVTFDYDSQFTVFTKFRLNKKSVFLRKFRLIKKKGRFYGDVLRDVSCVLWREAHVVRRKKRLTKLYKNKLIVSTTHQAIKMLKNVYI